jgi:hypothetical protein
MLRMLSTRIYSVLRYISPASSREMRYRGASRQIHFARQLSSQVRASLPDDKEDSDNISSVFDSLVFPTSGFGTDFKNSDYSIPERLNILARNNGHLLDANLMFDDDEHIYYHNGDKIKYSVTQLLGQYTEEFEALDAIIAMKKSKKWPRPEYTNRDGTVWEDHQIKEFWDKMGLYSRNRGTWMHYNIERYFNGLDIYHDLPEMKQFLSFYDEYIIANEIQPYRTEWRICAPELSLAGSVDFVGRLHDGTYVIIDWKRSKKLQDQKPNFFTKNMKAPLSHLDDSDTLKYYLQLNIYRYLLQKYYHIPVSRMILAAFHPENLDMKYTALEVPLLDEEVTIVMNELQNNQHTSI